MTLPTLLQKSPLKIIVGYTVIVPLCVCSYISWSDCMCTSREM